MHPLPAPTVKIRSYLPVGAGTEWTHLERWPPVSPYMSVYAVYVMYMSIRLNMSGYYGYYGYSKRAGNLSIPGPLIC